MRYWIKLYTEIVRDPKMGRLTDRQFRTCINLFALAGTVDEDGKLPPLEDMAWHLRTDDESLTADLEALARVNIVELRDDAWYVRKWADRQAKPPSDQPDQVAQRVRNHRARKRNESVTPLQPGVTTPETETETDVDTEKKREETETGTETPPDAPWWSAWKASRPESWMVNPMDKRNLGQLANEYGPDVLTRAIEYANAHKNSASVSLVYVEKTLAGWKADGKLNGNGQTGKRTPGKQSIILPSGEVVEATL
jgi:hypothetical protein